MVSSQYDNGQVAEDSKKINDQIVSDTNKINHMIPTQRFAYINYIHLIIIMIKLQVILNQVDE